MITAQSVADWSKACPPSSGTPAARLLAACDSDRPPCQGRALSAAAAAGCLLPATCSDNGLTFRAAAQLDSNLRAFPSRLTGQQRADGWNTWALALFQEIASGERVKLQLRAEAVDALNHGMFNGPNTAPVKNHGRRKAAIGKREGGGTREYPDPGPSEM